MENQNKVFHLFGSIPPTFCFFALPTYKFADFFFTLEIHGLRTLSIPLFPTPFFGQKADSSMLITSEIKKNQFQTNQLFFCIITCIAFSNSFQIRFTLSTGGGLNK